MRKLTLFLISFLLFVGTLNAQQKANLTAASASCLSTNCLSVGVDQTQGGATFTLSGTFSGTVQFEASGDGGATWVALNVTPSNSTTAATSATAGGTWQANVAGYTNVRERISAYASGTVVASIIESIASARANGGGGGGGGGSGTVTEVIVAGTANQITATGTCDITTTGTCTLSIPSSPTLPGTTSGTFSGALTGNVTGNVSGTSGSTTGNAATATALATARAINGTNFDGTAAITVPVNNANDTTNASYFPLFTATQGGNYAAKSLSTWTFNPSTGAMSIPGALTATSYSTSSGSTAGYFQCTQGTANGHATANTLTIECPASVTAYELVMPGASASGLAFLTNSSNVDTLSITNTPALGTDNSVAGTLTLSNGSANAHTIFSSGATTTNTIQGFAAVPTTGHLLDCTVTSTTCLMHDSGVVTANVVNASSPGAGIAHFAGSTQNVTSSAIVAADITNNTITGTQLASSLALVTPAIGAATGTSLLATGIVDGEAPVIVTTGTTGTPGATYNHSYSFNEEATAGTGVIYTLPTAAAGKQYCVANAYNGSNPNTGTLEILTSASGQFIIYTDGTLSATGGYVLSGGAAGDAACVVGVDATHWYLYVQAGTWAKH